MPTPRFFATCFKYDSVHGVFRGEAKLGEEGVLVIDGKEIKVLSERDPAKLPWKELKVDVAVESTGPLHEPGQGSRSPGGWCGEGYHQRSRHRS